VELGSLSHGSVRPFGQRTGAANFAWRSANSTCCCSWRVNPGVAFSRDQLLMKVWGPGFDGYAHTVNSHINRLRAKLAVDEDLSPLDRDRLGAGVPSRPGRGDDELATAAACSRRRGGPAG
jgi:hypothetical protein